MSLLVLLIALQEKGPDSWGKAWVVEVDFASRPAPIACAGDRVYAVDEDRDLLAVEGGKVVWKFRLPHYGLAAPAAAKDGSLAIGLMDGHVLRIDEKGREIWRFKTGGPVSSTPAFLDDGTTVVGSRDDHLYAISAQGGLVWKRKTGGWLHATPVVRDGIIYAGCWDGKLHAFDAKGAERWTFATDRPITAAPAVGEGVYVGSEDGKLYALDREGKLRWSFETKGWISRRPLLLKDRIVVHSRDGKLYSLDLQGALQWELETGAPKTDAVADARGVVYVGAESGLLAVGPDGKVRWSEKASGGWAAAVLSPTGTLFVQANNYVYAVRD